MHIENIQPFRAVSLIALFLCLIGCSPHKGAYVIEWRGGNRLEELSYIVDGQTMGNGKAAFDEVIRKIGTLPDSSSLLIRYPNEAWNEMTPGFHEDDLFPFREHENLRNQFQHLSIAKHFTIKCDPY